MNVGCTHDKGCSVEEPYEVKVSRTVLKTSGSREGFTEFNSSCGQIGGKKELNVREWTCLYCEAEHDRDINAALNILNAKKTSGGWTDRHYKWTWRGCQTTVKSSKSQ